jgi:ribosomal protein S10
MQYIQFILEGTSNKQLDALAKELVNIIRNSGAIKAGPIPSKNKRLVYCYGINSRTFNRLMAFNANKYKKVQKISVETLERP